MRIRSVKPEFLRHKGLQKLERENPGQYVMLTFEGLWLASDKQGVFAWDADYLHLDILPFLAFDFEKTLAVLEAAGEIESFESNGKTYGYIPSFPVHQRISGEEAKASSRYPSPEKKQVGSRSEAGEKQDGSTSVDPSRPGKGNGVGEREREKSARGAVSEVQETSKKPEEASSSPLAPPRSARFQPPSVDQVRLYCDERRNAVDPQTFCDFYAAKGWKIGKDPMKDWQAAVRTWEKRSGEEAAKKKGGALALRDDAWTDKDREEHQAGLDAKAARLAAEGGEDMVNLAELAAGTPLGKALAGRKAAEFADTG